MGALNLVHKAFYPPKVGALNLVHKSFYPPKVGALNPVYKSFYPPKVGALKLVPYIDKFHDRHDFKKILYSVS